MINTHPTQCNICGGPVVYTSNANIYSDTTTTDRDTLTSAHNTLTGSGNTLTETEKKEEQDRKTSKEAFQKLCYTEPSFLVKRCGNCLWHLHEKKRCIHAKGRWTGKDEHASGCKYWERDGVHYDVPVGKAPPIGIMPEYIWKRKRYSDLCDAIGRYVLAGMKPLPEWVEEGQRLLKEIESPEVRFSLSEPIGVCTGDPVGPKGPPGVCPRCGGTDITWEPSSDVSRCNTCGWSDGRVEHGIP